ncbi:MAG TPA: outer membrane lipoprotein carrier protein LolA [Pyrinomonadaceae bacterium]|nr:outer membrane lipoprotein carrier protein LolA [Pyrinomonadaceae bacterium]
MNRLVPLFLALVVVATTLTGASPKEANGQTAGVVSGLLNRMENNRKNLTSLRAGLSMEKYNSQLRDSERREGVVLYVPSGKGDPSVRIEWTSPQKEILAVHKGKYTLFRPRRNEALVGKSGSVKGTAGAGGILDLMYMSRQQLEARFQPVQDVREETLWGGVSTIHITLVPKGAASFKYAEIWVDKAGMPVQTKIVEKNDDATTMRLQNLEKNIKIASNQFVIDLDPSVKVVKS